MKFPALTRTAQAAVSAAVFAAPAVALADWPQFRGPDGVGAVEVDLLDTWSDDEGVVWKTELPGTGASSPVVVGDKVFLTSAVGDAVDLERHVLCLDAATGEVLWDETVGSDLPEQREIREDHGYASATPAATADRLFVFFGKSGVFCFGHDGNRHWHADVGDGLGGWGSAASLTLWGDTVLVNACVESESLVALQQSTGQRVWTAEGIRESWHAPVIAPAVAGGTGTEVIAALAGEVRSFDAATGEPLWQCQTDIGWYMCPLPLVRDGVVYAVGGRGGTGGLAVRRGGRGDVTASHRLWTLQKGTNVPSPILHGGHLYFVHENSGVAHCVDTASGEFVYSERLEPNPGQVYASPIIAHGKIYYFGRGGRTVVVDAKPEFGVLSSALLEDGRGVFNASPAVHGDRLLIRSNRFLYCIGNR